MSYIMVDIEADGPIPGDYSMVAIGAVLVEEPLDKQFYARLKPISGKFVPSYLEVSGHSRKETMSFEEPTSVMSRFGNWVKEAGGSRPFFISDNPLDWMFVTWYFHHFLGDNPFDYNAQNLGSIYRGMVKNVFESFAHLRKTVHDHHPLNDALGNAEAMLYLKNEMGLVIG